MITRTRLGKVDTFKEGAYKQTSRVEKIINNLSFGFGYTRLEARILAKQIIENLDIFATVAERTRQEVAPKPTQTYWRSGSPKNAKL